MMIIFETLKRTGGWAATYGLGEAEQRIECSTTIAWWWEHQSSLDDFPTLAPRFETFWLEGKMPETSPIRWADTFACLVRNMRVPGTPDREKRIKPNDAGELHPVGDAIPIGWTIQCDIWMAWGKNVWPKPIAILKAQLEAGNGKLLNATMEPNEAFAVKLARMVKDNPQPLVLAIVTSMMQAIPFLHATATVFDSEAPSRQVKRASERSGVEPPFDFLVLNTKESEQHLRLHGLSGLEGAASAFKRCGDHFPVIETAKAIQAAPKTSLWVP